MDRIAVGLHNYSTYRSHSVDIGLSLNSLGIQQIQAAKGETEYKCPDIIEKKSVPTLYSVVEPRSYLSHHHHCRRRSSSSRQQEVVVAVAAAVAGAVAVAISRQL